MALLTWHSLIFLIPIGVGTILAVGAAFALEAGHADPGEGGESDADGSDAATLPDVGRLPVTIRLMLGSLSFGGIGLCLTYLMGGAGTSALHTLVAAAVALAAAVFISGRVARLCLRRLPLLETETVSRRDLLGSVGRAVLPLGPAGGLAHVHDRRGNLHQVPCRTLDGEPELAAGTEVLLVDYDERRGLYRATASPLAVGAR